MTPLAEAPRLTLAMASMAARLDRLDLAGLPVMPGVIWSRRGVLNPRLTPPFRVSASLMFHTAYARGESLPPKVSWSS